MDVIKVCPKCAGEGFHRVEWTKVDPFMNVAYADAEFLDGVKMRYWDVKYYRPDDPTHLVFACNDCRESGEIMWRRGMSLVPDCT